MKQLLAAVLLCACIQTTYAQIEKGNQHLGLSFGVYTNTATTSVLSSSNNTLVEYKAKNTSYSVAPTYSYFIADKLDLGVSVGYSYSKSDYGDANVYPNFQTNRAFTSSLQLRKYVLFNDKIGLRTGPVIEYSKGNRKYIYPNSPEDIKESYNTYSGGLKLDFVYFPVKKIALAAGVGNIYYTHQKTSGNQPATSNTFQANFVNNLNFTFYYVL